MKRAVVTLSLGAIVVSCGGGQTRGSAFDTAWFNDDGAAARAFQKGFTSTIPRGADVAIGIVGKDTLIGAPLAGGPTWTFTHALSQRPVIAGSAVVAVGAGELFALDAITGKQLWKRQTPGVLRGAGDDGKTTVVSLSSPARKGSLVLAISRDGNVIRQVEDEAPIGTPAVVDGIAFLPWAGQYVSAFDLQTGDERARILLRSQTSRAFTADGALFFGEAGATRFDDKIGNAPKGNATTVMLPARELPGAPKWMSPGTEAQPLEAMAPDKIRLYARPTSKGSAGVESDRFAATYYRIAVGFESGQGKVAWSYLNATDFLGGDAYAGGFALCDESGKVTMIDAKTGAAAAEISLGKKLDACIVQTDGLSATGGKAGPLAEQLARAVTSNHAELVTIQKVLLTELAKLEDESVTQTLIEVTSNQDASPDLVPFARKSLAARRTGLPFMRAALTRHYDFLTDSLRPPPVAPIADALAALKDKFSAPLLAMHLNDPANSTEDVEHAAQALVSLATPAEAPALQAFFAAYRGADGIEQDEALQNAVVYVAQALKKIGAGDIVAAAAKDPFTNSVVRSRL